MMRSECDPDELDSRFHVTVNEDDVNVSILSMCGATCSSWYDGMSDQSFMVDPLIYFTTGVTKAVVCVILSVGWYI